MKTKNSIFWIMLLLLNLFSCDKFLKEDNKSGLTADPFYTTQPGFESLINACYTPLRYWYGREEAINFTETGTDIITKGSGNTNTPVNDYSVDFNGSNAGLTNLWTWLYQAVNFTNAALERAPSVNMPEATKTIRIGEASFLRAFYYWHIAEFWGNTHFTTKESLGVITTATMTDVATIYAQIFKDLDVAIANCTDAKQSGGRVTKYAAMGLKARLCLSRASETNDAQLYAEAATLAKDVIGSGKFSLFTDFKKMWDMSNSEGSTNAEVIWYVNYSTNLLYNLELDNATQIRTGSNNAFLMFNMKYDDQPGMTRDILNGRPFNRYQPTKFLFGLMDTVNDQRWRGSFKWVWKANVGASAFPIKNYPLMTLGDTAIMGFNGVATASQKAAAAGKYQVLDYSTMFNADGSVKNRKQYIEISKFLDPTRASFNEDRSVRDAFVLRLAEMYLIVAEAEMISNADEALSYLNILRTTRAIAGHEANMTLDATSLNVDFMLDERAREFMGEQLRWFDLKRTNKLVERCKLYNFDSKVNITDNHMVRPFPQSFLDAITNKADFPQHAGYK